MIHCSVGHSNPVGSHFCNTCGEALDSDHVQRDSGDASHTLTETFSLPLVAGAFQRAAAYTLGVAHYCAHHARTGWEYDDSWMSSVGTSATVRFSAARRRRQLPEPVGTIEVARFGASDFNIAKSLNALFNRNSIDQEIQQWRASADNNGWIVWFRYRFTYNSYPAVMLGYERPASTLPPPPSTTRSEDKWRRSG